MVVGGRRDGDRGDGFQTEKPRGDQPSNHPPTNDKPRPIHPQRWVGGSSNTTRPRTVCLVPACLPRRGVLRAPARVREQEALEGPAPLLQQLLQRRARHLGGERPHEQRGVRVAVEDFGCGFGVSLMVRKTGVVWLWGATRGGGSRTVQPRHRGGGGRVALGLARLPLLLPLLLLLLLGRLGVPPDQGVILQLGARLEGGGDEEEVRVLEELRLLVGGDRWIGMKSTSTGAGAWMDGPIVSHHTQHQPHQP